MRRIASVTAAALLITTLILATPPAASANTITHVVLPGENLYRIALRYGTTVEAIARANGIADPARILPGQVLAIPRPVSDDQRGHTPQTNAPQARPQQASVPKAVAIARSYRVQRGDSLYTIARRFGTTVEALKAANGLRSDLIHPGQNLRIPGRGAPVPRRTTMPIQPVVIPPLPVERTTEVLPAPEVGSEILAPQALRVRRGPKSYFTTLTLVAPDTPLIILSEEDTWYEVQLPEGEVGWVHEDDLRIIERVRPDPAAVRGVDIVRDALRFLGIPYRWGGSTERSLDCSGFVYIVFRQRISGLARMRSFDYFQMGVPVDGPDLLPGDLVFFTTYAPGPSHVGIYVGEGKFIHASSGARRVVVSPLTDSYYAARYLGARRILSP